MCKMLVDVESYYSMPRWVAGMIAGVFGQDRINRKLTSSFFGPRLPLKSGYARRLLENCEYSYKLNPDYLSRIPTSGPALFVANHPSGIFDGAMLYDAISELRPDVRIVANRFFECLKQMENAYLFVDMDRGHQSAGAMKPLLRHVDAGRSLILFPAGSISRLGWRSARDRVWSPALFALAARRGIPIIPIHINCHASVKFYLTAAAIPPLAPLAALGDMYRLKGRQAAVEFGAPVTPRSGDNHKALADTIRKTVDGPLRRSAARRQNPAIAKPDYHGLRDHLHRAVSTLRLSEHRWGAGLRTRPVFGGARADRAVPERDFQCGRIEDPDRD